MGEPTGPDCSETVPGHLSGPARLCYRTVLRYFRRQSTEVATIDDLATFVQNQSETDEARVDVYLHHVTLPRLADDGHIEYDARSNTIRYRGTGEGTPR